jgi:hypothetical protein
MRAMARAARGMVMATKSAIARKREMASNDNNKTMATETTMTTTTITSMNTITTIITLTLIMKTMTKMATTTMQWRWLVVAFGGGGGQQTRQRRGLNAHIFIKTGFWVLLGVGAGQGRQAGS